MVEIVPSPYVFYSLLLKAEIKGHYVFRLKYMQVYEWALYLIDH